MNFECNPCVIFEGLSYHQEDKGIDPTIFVTIVVFGRTNKEVSLLKLKGHGDLSFSHF